MPSSAAAVVVLSDEEREQLERWTRRRSSAQALALRARIVLLAAEGLKNTEIAEQLEISRATAATWRARFAEHRLDGLLDEQACYDCLLRVLHPDGLHCPQGHPLPPDQAPHRRRRPVIPDYRCRHCGAVFNLFSGTICWKTCYRCSTIVQILRGIAQGIPSLHLSDELGISRTHLLSRPHEIHTLLAAHFSP